jgi:hypothetical protein
MIDKMSDDEEFGMGSFREQEAEDNLQFTLNIFGQTQRESNNYGDVF